MFALFAVVHPWVSDPGRLQRLHHWRSSGMDKWFHFTLYWAYDYISMLELKSIRVSKGGRYPDSKFHGANMGPTRVLPAPDGPHVGPMNLGYRVDTKEAQNPVFHSISIGENAFQYQFEIFFSSSTLMLLPVTMTTTFFSATPGTLLCSSAAKAAAPEGSTFSPLSNKCSVAVIISSSLTRRMPSTNSRQCR